MLFNIQRCSNHDGAGLRTTVFLKGCPLRCAWCANPESQSFRPEVMEATARCVGCMACREECPARAIEPDETGYPRIRRELCRRCFHCAEVCYAESKHVVGNEMPVEELFREIEKDRVFFSRSGGGVTFSGGEPLAQPELLTAIAKRCHDSGIHVMLESCGCAEYDRFAPALDYVDAMYFDVKHVDPEAHRRITGADNRLILENLRRIAARVPVTVRTPVVPGYTDGDDNIAGIAAVVRDTPGVQDYELLAYHDLGRSKYTALGRPYALAEVEKPSPERMAALVELANGVLAGSGKRCFYLP